VKQGKDGEEEREERQQLVLMVTGTVANLISRWDVEDQEEVPVLGGEQVYSDFRL